MLSQTDVKRLWGIKKGPLIGQFQVKTISETECFSEVMKKVTLPPIDTDDDFFKELHACVPSSVQYKNL